MKTVQAALRTAVTLACAAWATLFLAGTRAVHWALFDDSYYYFAIARNLASGGGSTFDRLHPTNGYHPLWLLLCAIPFRFGLDDERAVQLLLAVQAAALGLALHVALGILERRARAKPDPRLGARGLALGGALLVGFSASPLGVTIFVNGLESTCSLLALVLLLARLDASDGELGPMDRFAVSVLAALAFLARTDAILLLPWLGGVAWARGARGRELAQLLALPVVVVAAYLAFNRVRFGAATQVSGDLKRVVPSAGAIAVGAAVALSPLLALAALARAKVRLVPTVASFVRATAPVFGFAACVVAYYETLQPWPQVWYFVAPAFYAALLVALALVDLGARQEVASRLVVSGVSLALAALVIGSVADERTPGATAMLDADREAGRWMRDNTAPSEIFASWDAGALGYYSHRRVVNLDGEVGSVGYARALRAGKTAEWLRSDRAPISYVVNHTFDEDGGDARLREIARSYLGDAAVARWTVVRAWHFTYRGGANGKAPRRYPMAVWLARLD